MTQTAIKIMNKLNFTYEKANGDVSDRKLVSFANANTNIIGIDITDEDENLIADFTESYTELLDKQKAETAELLKSYGLSNNYRQFKRSGIYNMEVIKL